MEPGSLIREVRKARKMTLNELADGIVSFSTLASFERNETMISFESLFLILKKLNLTIGEFVRESNAVSYDYLLLIKKIELLLKNHDEKGFNQLIKDLTEATNKLVDVQGKMNLIMVKSIGNQFLNIQPPTQGEIEFFQEYLFLVQKINHYELTLLGNCYRYFPVSFISSICSKIILQIQEEEYSKNLRDSLRVIINCILYFFEENELKKAEKLIDRTMIITPQSYIYERIYLAGLRIIYQKKVQGNSEVLVREADKIISFLSFIEADYLEENILTLFKDFEIL